MRLYNQICVLQRWFWCTVESIVWGARVGVWTWLPWESRLKTEVSWTRVVAVRVERNKRIQETFKK